MISSLLHWMRRLTRVARISFREVEEPLVLSMDADSPAQHEPAELHLESFEDVDGIRPTFEQLRVDWCGSSAAAKACIAQLDGNKFAVFAKPGEVGSDIYRAVFERAQAAAKSDLVRVYTINPVVLLALVRERMQLKDVRERSSGSRASSQQSPVRIGFKDICAWGVRNGASDLHFNIDTTSPTSQVCATIDGQYTRPKQLAMPTERMVEMGSVAWLDVYGGNGLFLDMVNEQQGRLYEVIDDRNYLLRWGSYITDNGPSITLRILDVDARVECVGLDTLGFLPTHEATLLRCLNSTGGAIIFGGVPGSGKTVSIGQLIVRLPQTRKINTLEDPVELQFRNALQATFARTLNGLDREALAAKLNALKRAAGTDAFLGEVRDDLTGDAFVDLVHSGTSVYTTTHVGEALGIPGRFSSSKIRIPHGVLGTPGVLKLLAHQALLPALCSCALPSTALADARTDMAESRQDPDHWKRYLDDIEVLYDFASSTIQVRNPEGCPKCRARGIPELYGYAGRTVVAEMFEPSSDPEALHAIAIGNELRLRQVYADHRQAAYDNANMDGKTTMDCAVYKMSQGTIDPRDIERYFTSFATLRRKRQTE